MFELYEIFWLEFSVLRTHDSLLSVHAIKTRNQKSSDNFMNLS